MYSVSRLDNYTCISSIKIIYSPTYLLALLKKYDNQRYILWYEWKF